MVECARAHTHRDNPECIYELKSCKHQHICALTSQLVSTGCLSLVTRLIEKAESSQNKTKKLFSFSLFFFFLRKNFADAAATSIIVDKDKDAASLRGDLDPPTPAHPPNVSALFVIVVNGVWPVSELRLSFPPAVKPGRTTTCHRCNLCGRVEKTTELSGGTGNSVSCVCVDCRPHTRHTHTHTPCLCVWVESGPIL